MGVAIEAGKNWYMADDEKSDSGLKTIPNLDQPANGVIMGMGHDISGHCQVLANTGRLIKSLTIVTSEFVTLVGFEDIDKLSLEITSFGQVMKGLTIKGETDYALIGHGSHLLLGTKGDPNYLRIANHVEFEGQLVESVPFQEVRFSPEVSAKWGLILRK